MDEEIMEPHIFTKEEIKHCRHKAEKRWYRRLCILNILAIIVVSAWFYNSLDELQNLNENDSLPLVDELFFGGVLLFLFLPIVVNIIYQSYRSRALRVTPKNFPEIYDKVALYSKQLGLKKVPDCYIMQENGIMNALSSFIVRRQYIEISADLFEVAYREHQDMDTLSFIIGHEMAHIRLKNSTFWYYFKIMFSIGIPIFGSTASRAREYSCDRLAQKLTETDGMDAMFALMMGKHLYKSVDKEDYLAYAKEVRGFCLWCYNLISDHPVMTKRIQALAMGEGSGKLY